MIDHDYFAEQDTAILPRPVATLIKERGGEGRPEGGRGGGGGGVGMVVSSIHMKKMYVCETKGGKSLFPYFCILWMKKKRFAYLICWTKNVCFHLTWGSS